MTNTMFFGNQRFRSHGTMYVLTIDRGTSAYGATTGEGERAIFCSNEGDSLVLWLHIFKESERLVVALEVARVAATLYHENLERRICVEQPTCDNTSYGSSCRIMPRQSLSLRARTSTDPQRK